MLRKIRLTLAVLCFATVTLLFLDFTGTLHTWLGWTAKIQFLPALLALNVGIVGFFVLVTLVFGRVYCSVICPLGVMQDIIAWMGKKQKKNRYCYSPAKSWLRYGVLAVFVVAMIAGIGSLVACGPAHVRRDRLSGKRTSNRNTFQNARTYQFEGYTSLCQNHIHKSHGGHEGIKEQAEGLEAGIRSDEI